MNNELEVGIITDPKAFVDALDASVRARRDPETKYDFQMGLKDVDFDVDEETLAKLGLAVPFAAIPQAEQALQAGGITPREFVENDGTLHEVTVFDPEPLGFSGFMDCVTHSLSLTNQGLFEVGRYPAVQVEGQHRYWQWFLHRRLATRQELATLREDRGLSAQQIVDACYEALTGKERSRPNSSSGTP